MEDQPIEKQMESPGKRKLKNVGFWVIIITIYGFVFALPSIMNFLNPSTEAGFDIIGFFVNMSDEKRLNLMLGLMTIMLALLLHEISKRGH